PRRRSAAARRQSGRVGFGHAVLPACVRVRRNGVPALQRQRIWPLRVRSCDAGSVMESVTFSSNRASEEQIAEHLSRCDESFVPPLSGRVEIADYAHKIADMATRFEAWDGALVGLLAVYCNDHERGVAYVTSVSVLQQWRSRGIPASLVDRCIAHAKAAGF